MAFGPPPSKKFSGKVGTVEDQNWRSYCKAEEDARKQWKGKWGWIIDEFSILKKDLDEMTDKYVAGQSYMGKQYPHDPRTIKPIPETISHQMGWLAGRPEFKLEKFGPDVEKPMPFKCLHS